MKNFNRRNMPAERKIKYNQSEYFYLSGTVLSMGVITGYCKANNLKMVQVSILSRKLEQATDLHNKPYTPSTFIFTSPGTSDAQRRELSDLIRQANEFKNEMTNK